MWDLDIYQKFLLGLRSTGRVFQTYRETPNPGLILRVDVDYDLNWAAQLAKLHANHQVKGVFFVQVASALYNIFEPQNQQALLEITKQGQHLALHIEADPLETLEIRIQRDFAILREAVRQEPPASKNLERVLAWHNPGADLSAANEIASRLNFENSYAPQWFGPEKYRSDSNGRNTPEQLIEWAQRTSESVLQILVHPFNYIVGGKDISEILLKTFEEKKIQLSRHFEQNKHWQFTREKFLEKNL